MMVRCFQDTYHKSEAQTREAADARAAAAASTVEPRSLGDRIQQIRAECSACESRPKFLALLEYMMIQKDVDVRDVLMRLKADLEGERAGCYITIDYDGLRQDYFFHPQTRLGTNYDVAPEHRLAVAQSFSLPLVCGVPTEAIAGRPDLLNRKVRLPSLAGSSQDCLDYLESRFQNVGFRDGKYLLHGDDGTGKTTMTCALVQRLYWKRDCASFFWIRATNSTLLYYDCITISKFLGLVDDGEDQLDIILARLRQWMIQRPGWFMVLEDAEDEAVVDLLDLPMQHGMLLVTARPSHWKSILWQNVVELEALSHDEGIAFVHRFVKKEQPLYVDSLLKELHFHPLSISLALSYIRTEKSKISTFNSQKKPVDLAAETRYCAVGMTKQERIYLSTVRAVITCTMKTLSPTQQVMLVACACSHCHGIHRNIFADSKDCDKYFDTLLRYGCLEVSGDATFDMHPLLQLAVREQYPDLHNAGLQHLCALLEKGMSYRDKEVVSIRAERAEWIVHVLESKSLGGTFSFPFLIACADHLARKMHDFDESLSLLRTLRELLSEREIITHLGGVDDLAGMQILCKDENGKPVLDSAGKQVLASYPSKELSLTLNRMVTQEVDYPRMLTISLHTGETLMRRQELPEAQHQFEQFLSLFNSLGCQRDGVFTRATCLVGDCLRAQGKHAEALNRYEEALHTCAQFANTSGTFD